MTSYDDTVDADDKDIITEAKERFKLSQDAFEDNRQLAIDDLRFSRLAEQWPEAVRQQREEKNRPCLTINKLPAIIRQVVNDARQNKPSIKTRPVDSKGDPETSEIINGLIRNIEYTSNASAAYDTAVDFATSAGFGYIRVDVDYAHEDSFDEDICIERVANPFSVYPDHNATEEDSRNWNYCFIVDRMSKEDFKEKYKGEDVVDWEAMGTDKQWMDEDSVQIAEYWTREEVEREIYLMSDGVVLDKQTYLEMHQEYTAVGVAPVNQRMSRGFRVMKYIMSGAEVLEKMEWKGSYIPIVPVYGEEINVEGERFFRSLIRDAKDAQRNFNYWRTASTELVALAPKAPYVGKKGAFNTDLKKWTRSNVENFAFIEYDGDVAPQRQPFAGVPAGALQESMNANDDIKSTTGIFDASMGARGNETSGKAILARQREGDTSTFHIQDNLTRAIKHCGRIILDLLPHYYPKGRIIRILGEDDKEPKNVQLDDIHDLTIGKYDIVMDVGPSYTTKRQESAEQMMELIRVQPQAAQIMGDLLASNLDWPGADDIAKRFKAVLPPEVKAVLQDGQGGEQDPEMLIQQMTQLQQQMQEGQQILQQLQQENEELKTDKSVDVRKVQIDEYKAETDRIKVQQDGMTPEQVQQLILQTLQQVQS